VVTLTDEDALNKHGRIIMEAFPELEVVSRCIEDQPYGIYDRESEEVAKPKVLRLVERFEEEGFDAVIVSCAADPAVDEARRVVKIPVVGAGSAVASLALAYGRRVGVLNLTEETPEAIRRVLGPHLVAESSPRGVRNTLDLLRDWGQRAAFEALKELTARGVDVVVLGCTGYSTIEFARRAREVAGVPVLDPVLAAGAVTLGILKQR
jgi:Asp/Glu/hydantoin racemase